MTNIKDRVVKVMLDPRTYKEKPQADDVAGVNYRLTQNQVDIGISNLFDAIERGQTWTFAAFNKNEEGKVSRKKKNWKQQDIVALDFDSGIKVFEVYSRAVKYGIKPSMIYYTFSHTLKKNRFRVIWILDRTITDFRDANASLRALLEIFPEADEQCKDVNRLFYGASGVYIRDDKQTITPQQIMNAMGTYHIEQDPKHWKRKVGNFCKSTALNMTNGVPRLIKNETKEQLKATEKVNFLFRSQRFSAQNVSTSTSFKKWGKTSSSIYIYYRARHISPFDEKYKLKVVRGVKKEVGFFLNEVFEDCSIYGQVFSYSVSEHDMKNSNIIAGRDGKVRKSIKYDVDNLKKRQELERDFDFEGLELNCPLWKGFTNGEIYPFEDEFFGIASNMLLVRGGEKRIKDAIDIMPNASDEQKEYYKNKIIYMKNEIKYPTVCQKYCPRFAKMRDREENIDVYDICKGCQNRGTIMLHTVDLKRSQIRKIEDFKYSDIEQSRLDLHDEITHHLAPVLEDENGDKDTRIIGIKAQTGIGKTEVYVNTQLENTIVAVPTHILKDEVAERFKKTGQDPLVVPKLPSLPEDLQAQYDKYTEMGAYSRANMVIKDYVEGIIRATPNPAERTEEEKEIINYVLLKQAAPSSSFALTTQDSMLFTEWTHADTILIDEDPIKKLLRQGITTMGDLGTLYDTLPASVIRNFRSFYETIEKSKDFVLQRLPRVNIDGEVLTESIIKNKEKISSALIEFITCDYYIKMGNTLSFIKHKKLPKNKKIVIVSATIDHEIYKMLYGDRYVAVNIERAKPTGNLVQYAKYSYSRSHIRQHLKRTIDKVKETEVKDIITFKEFKPAFEKEGFNVVATLGATEGLDQYSGKDIAVVGTPHINPVAYMLYAAITNTDYNIFSAGEASYQAIVRNGYEFSFTTYAEDSLLKTIQLFLIESELEQAVGRSRILNNNATVHLFSNLPLIDSNIITDY